MAEDVATDEGQWQVVKSRKPREAAASRERAQRLAQSVQAPLPV